MEPILQLIGLLSVLVFQGMTIPTSEINGKYMVCYFGSWSVYRKNDAKFTVEDMKPELCTHIIYTFIGLNEVTSSVKLLDGHNDKALLPKICEKARAAGTKCLVALGGWNEGSKKYSQVVCDPAKRSKLIKSVIGFVKKFNLDGFDLDWEYPTQREGRPKDRQCFSALIKALSGAFKKRGWVLSAAVSANKNTIEIAYDIPVLSQYLDMINVMTYDLHGSWESVTGHNAPLHASKADVASGSSHLSVSAAIKAWIEKGASPSKIVMGLGLYGRSFRLKDASKHGIGAPAWGADKAPHGWLPEKGIYGYNEICAEISSWTKAYDEVQKVPYVYSGTKWVGYDDPASIRIKSCFANKMKLGGLMVWSIETDDFRGKCGKEKYPLINAALATMKEGKCRAKSDNAKAENKKPIGVKPKRKQKKPKTTSAPEEDDTESL